MKKTILKLAMTVNDYEMMIFSFYSRWCESVTGNSRQYQQVLANSSINAWFLVELEKCEVEFHLLTNRYENLTLKDYQRCFNECTFRMFSIRPSALLEPILKGKMKFNVIYN